MESVLNLPASVPAADWLFLSVPAVLHGPAVLGARVVLRGKGRFCFLCPVSRDLPGGWSVPKGLLCWAAPSQQAWLESVTECGMFALGARGVCATGHLFK